MQTKEQTIQAQPQHRRVENYRYSRRKSKSGQFRHKHSIEKRTITSIADANKRVNNPDTSINIANVDKGINNQNISISRVDANKKADNSGPDTSTRDADKGANNISIGTDIGTGTSIDISIV